MKLKHIALALLATATTVFGASTVNLRNFSNATTGVPIVDSAGAALPTSAFFANAGYFTTTLDWGTATAANIIAAFVGVDTTPLAAGTRTGLFTGQTFNGVIGAAAGKNAYVVVANNSDFTAATLFAVFNAGTTFVGPDAFGNSAQTLDALNPANVVFGQTRSVTSQPSNLTGANFPTGVVMVASQVIPEPSAALLGAIGALGLLRRRRA